ncbi:hypothetical protein BH09PLA1_BH09PLA1_29440 [soil metagenome]
MDSRLPAHPIRLTDFLDLATLQEIQGSFAAVANVKARITDADGNVLTQTAPTSEFVSRQRAIAQAEEKQPDGPQKAGREYVAPISVNNLRLGTIRMTPADGAAAIGLDDPKLAALAERFGVDAKEVKLLAQSLIRARNTRPAAIHFLYLLANAIARLCYQEFQLRQRVDELSAVYNITMLLAEARELPRVLDRAVQLVTEAMGVKAASIRLLDTDNDDLITRAVFNLSSEYLNKGPVLLSRAEVDRIALSAQGYEYVRNMASDPRVIYPEEAAREGIASVLSVGMRYKGKPIGVLRIYTAEEHEFSLLQVDLMKAIAAQTAAAIENARLTAESIEAAGLEKQINLAREVQHHMLPQAPPIMHGLDLASVYVPCHALGGDFFDFIPLPYENVGLVIADVSGKGVPASLIMASVQAALRAQVDNVFYVYDVMQRLNTMLCRDTKPSEFVTLLYGVLDVPNKRFTFCNAGHPPAMLLRDGVVIELDSNNMVLGIDSNERYTQSILDLKSGDTLLLYTDGLADAMNFQKETFGRQRILDAYKQSTGSAETIAQNILWIARKFVGMTARNDDITMMVAKVE